MTPQTLILNMPDALYLQLRDRAARSQRTIEAETLDVIAAAIPEGELPREWEDTLASLKFFDDDHLWRAAKNRLPLDVSERIEALHEKQRSEGLSEAERRALDASLRQFERNMLVRAQAAVLLRERGHDVSVLVSPP